MSGVAEILCLGERVSPGVTASRVFSVLDKLTKGS